MINDYDTLILYTLSFYSLLNQDKRRLILIYTE